MAGKCRPSLRPKTMENVMRSSLCTTDKTCIKAMFERVELLENEIKAISEDAAKVVHCKDCVHEHLIACPLYFIEHAVEPATHDAEFFCGKGERRVENAVD